MSLDNIRPFSDNSYLVAKESHEHAETGSWVDCSDERRDADGEPGESTSPT